MYYIIGYILIDFKVFMLNKMSYIKMWGNFYLFINLKVNSKICIISICYKIYNIV